VPLAWLCEPLLSADFEPLCSDRLALESASLLLTGPSLSSEELSPSLDEPGGRKLPLPEPPPLPLSDPLCDDAEPLDSVPLLDSVSDEELLEAPDNPLPVDSLTESSLGRLSERLSPSLPEPLDTSHSGGRQKGTTGPARPVSGKPI